MRCAHPRRAPASSSKHALDAREVHAQLGGHLLDAAQALDVVLRVQPRALGRALGRDQPARLVHAQRLRVHLGQLGGDGDHEDAAVVGDRRSRVVVRGRARASPSARLLARRAARTAARAGCRSSPCESSSTASCCSSARATRDVDHEAVVDVAAALAAELRRALAAQALDGAVLGARRARAASCVPSSVGTSTVGAADRLGDRDRHLDLEVVALALEDRRVAHARDHVEVARRAAAQPGLALAGQPDRGCRRARRPGCSRGSA